MFQSHFCLSPCQESLYRISVIDQNDIRWILKLQLILSPFGLNFFSVDGPRRSIAGEVMGQTSRVTPLASSLTRCVQDPVFPLSKSHCSLKGSLFLHATLGFCRRRWDTSNLWAARANHEPTAFSHISLAPWLALSRKRSLEQPSWLAWHKAWIVVIVVCQLGEVLL